VVIFDLKSAAETGEATAAAIRARGGKCVFYCGSVCNEDDVDALFAFTAGEWGRVDVLVILSPALSSPHRQGGSSTEVQVLAQSEEERFHASYTRRSSYPLQVLY
jgi:NAD(P)-dependent dehydrogenase (short-subunit alcohol dehydrogenase family)